MNDCKVWKKLKETKSKHHCILQLNQQTQKLLKRDVDTLKATVFLHNVAEGQEHRLLASSSPRDTRMLSPPFRVEGIFNQRWQGGGAEAHIKLTFQMTLIPLC